jgi:hypothetical protein
VLHVPSMEGLGGTLCGSLCYSHRLLVAGCFPPKVFTFRGEEADAFSPVSEGDRRLVRVTYVRIDQSRRKYANIDRELCFD